MFDLRKSESVLTFPPPPIGGDGGVFPPKYWRKYSLPPKFGGAKMSDFRKFSDNHGFLSQNGGELLQKAQK